ncbi:hypothetical protein HDV00_010625, partial [Rhizophlyctis rosea]
MANIKPFAVGLDLNGTLLVRVYSVPPERFPRLPTPTFMVDIEDSDRKHFMYIRPGAVELIQFLSEHAYPFVFTSMQGHDCTDVLRDGFSPEVRDMFHFAWNQDTANHWSPVLSATPPKPVTLQDPSETIAELRGKTFKHISQFWDVGCPVNPLMTYDATSTFLVDDGPDKFRRRSENVIFVPSYTMKVIRNGGDDVLIRLLDHLKVLFETDPQPDEPPLFRPPSLHTIVLSHLPHIRQHTPHRAQQFTAAGPSGCADGQDDDCVWTGQLVAAYRQGKVPPLSSVNLYSVGGTSEPRYVQIISQNVYAACGCGRGKVGEMGANGTDRVYLFPREWLHGLDSDADEYDAVLVYRVRSRDSGQGDASQSQFYIRHMEVSPLPPPTDIRTKRKGLPPSPSSFSQNNSPTSSPATKKPKDEDEPQ